VARVSNASTPGSVRRFSACRGECRRRLSVSEDLVRAVPSTRDITSKVEALAEVAPRDGRHAEAAAHAQHGYWPALWGWGCPSGPHRVERRAHTAFLLHLPRVFPTAWIASVTVPLSRSKSAMVRGDALALRVQHDDDELPGSGGPGHQGMAHVQLVGDVREVLPRHDLEVGHGVHRPAGAASRGTRPTCRSVENPAIVEVKPVPKQGVQWRSSVAISRSSAMMDACGGRANRR